MTTLATVSTVEARSQFAELVNRAAFGKERIILTRRGKEVAAVVPLEDLYVTQKLIARMEDMEDLQEARAALEEADREGTISLEELERELGL